MSEERTVPYQFCHALVTAHIPVSLQREDWGALLTVLRDRAAAAHGRGDITGWRGQVEIGADAAARAASTGEAPRGHVQFFITSRSKATIRGWKQRLVDIFGVALTDAHIECARDPEAAWDYCGKDDTRDCGPEQVGDKPKGRAASAARASAAASERARSKSAAFHELIFVKRLRLEDVLSHPELGPAATFHTQHIERCIAIRDGSDGLRKEGQAPPRLWFLHGTTGAGKTRFAVTIAGGREYVFVKEGQTHWWCGYEPGRHKVILFDEASESSLRRCCCDVSWLLRAGDQWDCCALPRRGARPLTGIGSATTDIVITTNLPLKDVVRGTEEQWAALRRRGMEFGGGNLRYVERGGDGRSRAHAEWANFPPDLREKLRPNMVVWDDSTGQASSVPDIFRANLLQRRDNGTPGGGAEASAGDAAVPGSERDGPAAMGSPTRPVPVPARGDRDDSRNETTNAEVSSWSSEMWRLAERPEPDEMDETSVHSDD